MYDVTIFYKDKTCTTYYSFSSRKEVLRFISSEPNVDTYCVFPSEVA